MTELERFKDPLTEVRMLLAGRDPFAVFDPDCEGGRTGAAYATYLTANADNPGVTLHRWVGDSDETVYLSCFWEQPRGAASETYNPDEHADSIARVLEAPIRYGGALSHQEIVKGALAWLKRYGFKEKDIPILPPGGGLADQLGLGAAVYANHINNAARRAGVW